MADERKSKLTVLKFLELALSIACLVLHYYSFNDGDMMTVFLATGTYCGYIVIIFAILIGHLMNATIKKRLDIVYSLIGGALFIASGVLIIEAWEHSFRTRTRDLAILKGAMSIINGVICLFDCVFTFKDK